MLKRPKKASNHQPPGASIKSFTFVRPENPRARAAAGVTSITRPRVNGPRSLIRTTIERPFWVFVTRIIVPNGSERCAAVKFLGLNASPLVVLPPLSDWIAAIQIPLAVAVHRLGR